MENPHIDIGEILKADLDAQIVADEIALSIERFGALRFKAVAYKTLTRVKNAGAMGGEIVLAGRLPSERAKVWRFKFGHLKKTGDQRHLVDHGRATATDKMGVVGVSVSILKPDALESEHLEVTEELISKLKLNTTQDSDEKKTKGKTKK